MFKAAKCHTRMPGWLRLILTGLFVITFISISPASTWAHPLGNFTVNRYSRLRLGVEQIELHYVVDMAEIPTFQEQAHLDVDQDNVVSPAEQVQYLAGWVAALQGKLHLRVGGTTLKLEPQAQSLEFPPGQGGLPTLRLEVSFSATLPPQPRSWQAEYRDDNYVERLGWQEIVVQAAPGVALIESTAPAEDLSQELRHYPEDLLQSPPAISAASFRFEPQSAGTADLKLPLLENHKSKIGAKDLLWIDRSQRPPVGKSEIVNRKSNDPFAALITIPTLGPGALLLALLAAFGWGAAHALTPGHGKTIVAAYLVGAHGTTRHALFLGLTTTLTHTVGVFALGFITLFVSKFILPEQLYPWLGIASGLLVVAIGLSLFRGRLAILMGAKEHHHHHHHGHHHDHDHLHHHDGLDHHHVIPGADGSPVTWRNLLALGVSGGLLPCPSALVVMLGAITLDRIGFGLLLIFAFSLGLAGVLTAIGILFVHTGRLFERIPVSGRLVRVLPAASALFVTFAGLGITWQALVEVGLLQL